MPRPPPEDATPTCRGPSVYAGFWRRVLACLIDLVLLSLIIMVAAGAASAGGLTNPAGILGLLCTLLPMLYFVLFESSSLQGTLGKKALGAKVTDLQGRQITGGRAFGRQIGKLASGLTLGIGFAMAGITVKRQALHDMMSRCLVVRSVADTASIARDPGTPRAGAYTAAMIALTILCGPVSLGVLATAALRAYQNYKIPFQINDGLIAAGALKVQVDEYYADSGRWPQMTDLREPVRIGKYEKSIELMSGAIVIVYGGPWANPALNGMRLVLSPAATENNGVVWTCGSARAPADLIFSVDAAKNTSVPAQYLPSYCRS